MIRNVVLVRLPEGADETSRTELAEALTGIAGLRLPGQLDIRVGLDAGLREGGWDAAITNDWEDEDAYRAYDADPEHLRHRARIVAVADQVARVQIAI